MNSKTLYVLLLIGLVLAAFAAAYEDDYGGGGAGMPMDYANDNREKNGKNKGTKLQRKIKIKTKKTLRKVQKPINGMAAKMPTWVKFLIRRG